MLWDKEMVEEGALFDRTAQFFAQATDRLIRQGSYIRGQLILEAVGSEIQKGGRILDYGCGPGRVAVLLAQHGYSVHGVDLSAGMLSQACEYASRYSGLDLVFERASRPAEVRGLRLYNGVVCSSVVEYLSEPLAFLAEVRKLLVPGGHLILTYANKRSLVRRYAEIRFGRTSPHFRFQRNLWDLDKCRQVLMSAGFHMTRKPVYFESPWDSSRLPHLVRSSLLVGTLGLVTARVAAQ